MREKCREEYTLECLQLKRMCHLRLRRRGRKLILALPMLDLKLSVCQKIEDGRKDVRKEGKKKKEPVTMKQHPKPLSDVMGRRSHKPTQCEDDENEDLYDDLLPLKE
ncbi:uncharacterized protein LOC116810587 [Hylobates moloch]|uniref:uncharacterized protein LOC116810587 n=1 Tax=Hylobates moloch TaxID=81572 RepID=UPI002675186B|nr:uncharacterized protein LOC116810587 [Hylobates moloch]